MTVASLITGLKEAKLSSNKKIKVQFSLVQKHNPKFNVSLNPKSKKRPGNIII